jgi:hypothetical protein
MGGDIVNIPTERPVQFVYLVVGQILVGIVALSLLDSLDLEQWFVLALSIALVNAALTTPRTVRLRWRRRLHAVLFVLLIVFVYVAARRISEFVPENVPL